MKHLLDRTLDLTVVAGFSSIGFKARGLADDPVTQRLDGKRVAITGATGGLGLATARALSALGAETALIARDPDKLEAAAAEMVGPTSLHRADLGSMAEVSRLAQDLAGNVDILVNNIGVLFPERQITEEGLEATFATNLLGQFVLTNQLLPQMNPGSRIITVSSGGMYTTGIDLDDLQNEKSYNGSLAYARTKRAQVVLAEEWARRHPEVVSHSMHPGWADTDGVRRSLPTFRRITRPILRSAEQGADTIVFLAADPEPALSNGLFWHDRRPRATHRTKASRPGADLANRLWEQLAQVAVDVRTQEIS